MIRTLLDTNILLRSCEVGNSSRPVALDAVSTLIQSRRSLCISSQTIYEFLAVATRKIADNGLALTQADADAELAKLLAGIEVLFDSAEIAAKTRRLVVANQVTGKKVHDTRLVATLIVHGVSEILTFNFTDFFRYAGISVLVPADVAAGKLA